MKYPVMMMKPIPFIKQTLLDAVGIAAFKKAIRGGFRDSLHRNALYLMLNSAILCLAGFFFWAVAARLYPVEGVGFASAAISAMTLLALLSTLGLDYGLIRFLPGSGEKAASIINSCFTVSGLTSIVLSLIFLAGIGLWSPALILMRQHFIFFTAFVVFTAASTLHTLVHRTFIARRRSEFTLAQGLIFSLLRFVPLALLATLFHTFGIFASWGIALVIAVVVSILLFLLRIQTSYYPLPTIDKQAVNEMIHFSFANYAANIFWMLPSLVLPLMVVNLLGTESNAYFYIGWATASALFTVPIATSFSLFAEGSYDQGSLAGYVKRSLRLTFIILIPVILITFLLGDKILLIFGSSYSENAIKLLWILAVSALPLSINHIYFSIKRVEMKLRSVVGFGAFIAVFTLALSWFLLPQMGILGAGVAWLTSQGIVALITGYKTATNTYILSRLR